MAAPGSKTTAVLGSFMCVYYSVNFWYPTFLREAGRPTLPYLAAFNGPGSLLHAVEVLRSQGISLRRARILPDIGRAAEPEEMAEIIAFLCTPVGQWLRGQVIVTDGGMTLPWH